MVTKKKKSRKTSIRKRKPGAARKRPGKRKSAATKARKPAKARRPAKAARGKTGQGKSPVRKKREARIEELDVEKPEAMRGLGPEAGGQSGDIEGLSRNELADSESVEELIEEGQAFEAGVISGVENAPDADRGEVRTRQVPEDDVPQEYLDED